ncbi:MAG TPA: SDR family NAD(P)-dependent oxidoreductase, partial [bacterium]|nr:SDR family NAD(P)-dependent oxidoreductase [bacterium]
MQREIQQKGQTAVSVECDLSDIASVRRAAAEIAALRLPISGLLNNAGVGGMTGKANAAGWNL